MFNTLKELMKGIANHPGMLGDIYMKSGNKIEGFEILEVRDDFCYGIADGKYAYTVPFHSIDYIAYAWSKETSVAKGQIQPAMDIEGKSLPGDVIGDGSALDTMAAMASLHDMPRDYLENVTNYLWSKNKSKAEARDIAEDFLKKYNGNAEMALNAIKFRY